MSTNLSVVETIWAATPRRAGAGRRAATTPHRSLTDPDARLARKSGGQASILAYAGHVLMENRNGLVAQSCLTQATAAIREDLASADLVLLDDGAFSRRGRFSPPSGDAVGRVLAHGLLFADCHTARALL